MPDTTFAVKPSLSFAKLVATPTDIAWSQAYNAGNLFACLTLTQNEPNETISLQSLGKESLNILESEFFTLEEKTTETIKKAIGASLEKIPPEVNKNITVANFKDNILTVFIAGSGKIIMKRDDKIGVLLERYVQYEEGTISTASGYLEHKDTIILESGQFAQKVSEETIASAFELTLPNDIVELLSPQIHEHADGAQSAIVITFLSASPQPVETDELAYPEDQSLASLYSPELEIKEPPMNNAFQETETFDEEPSQKKHFKFPQIHIPKLKLNRYELSHKRKLYLTIAIILTALLSISIFMAVKKQTDEKQQAVFQSIYTPAKQYYEEGQGLESLNKPLSRESYIKAEQKLKESEGKISKGSDEDKQIQDLLAKIETALQDNPSNGTDNTKDTEVKENSLLAVEKANTSALGFGQDDKNVYIIDSENISSQSKSSGAKKEVIKNEDDWESPKAVVPYQANIYILDQKVGVIKYIGTSSKSSYFASDKPDLSKASGMAIDGSVWILTTDGKILKYTKAKKENFGLSGFDKSLNSPTKIFTTVDMDYIYILDNGNNRIVKIDKNGAFQKAINSSQISQAKDFDISEKDKKAYILSNNKTYELEL